MHERSDAAVLAERIERGGYDSAALEALFAVSQATASRLRNGRINRVGRYLVVLDRHETSRGGGESLDECLEALRRRAEVDPVMRDLLLKIRQLMQDA